MPLSIWEQHIGDGLPQFSVIVSQDFESSVRASVALTASVGYSWGDQGGSSCPTPKSSAATQRQVT